MNKTNILLIFVLLLSLCSFGVSASVNLNDDIVAYWKLDETSGISFADEVGSNTGTGSNERISGTDGKINKGADFTQGNDEISIPSEAVITGNNPRSISLWVKPSVIDHFVVAGYGSSSNGRGFSIDTAQRLSDFGNTWNFLGFGSSYVLTTKSEITTDWTHLVYVYTGTHIKIFVDDVEQDLFYLNGDSATGAISLDTASSVFGIGYRHYATSKRHFDGLIDEVAIWDRALTEDEITALYNSGTGVQYPFTTTEEINIYFDVGTTNSSVVFDDVILYNLTVEGNMTNATLFIYNSTELVHSVFIDNSTGSSPYKITGNYTMLADGVYYLNATGYDVNNLTVDTETRTIIYTTAPPSIIFTEFENNTWFSSVTEVPNITFTATSLLPNLECKYTIDGGITNTTINCTDESINETWVNNFNYITFYATDIANQTSSYNLVFSIRQMLFLMFKDELDFTNITSTVYVDIITDDVSFNYSTTNSTLNILVPYNYTNIIRYKADEYSERFHYINFETILPSPNYGGVGTYNLTLYLLNSSKTDDVTITVFDTSGAKPIPDVFIKYLKYDVLTNTYIPVGMAQTGLDGKTHLSVQKATEFYRFMIYYPLDVLRTTTAPYYIYEDNLNIQLDLLGTIGGNFATIMGVTSEVVYNNNTENFRFTYSNTAGTDISPTFTVYELTRTGKVAVNTTTTTSSAGTLLLSSPNVEGKTYIAEAKLQIGTQNYILASSEHSNPQDAGWGLAGLIAVIILTLVFISIGYFNLNVALILAPMPMLFGVMIGFVQIAMPIAVSLQVLAIFIVMVINK